MMNIEEIRDRLKLNPEPPEIEYIRNKITEAFKDIIFYPEPHKYFLSHEDGTQEELECVSNMAGRFVPEDDWDAIAERYAKKHNTTKELVQREWKIKNITSTTRGTAVHLAGENYNYFYRDRLDLIDPIIKPQIQDGWFIPLEGKQEAAQQFNEDVFNTPNVYPVMPETQVYTKEFKKGNNYAGTFDILLAYRMPTGDFKLAIWDYKTNEALEKPFSHSARKMLLPPFDDLYDEPLSHYILQLNLYQIALENIGFEIIDRRIVWLHSNGSYDKIPLPDVTQRLRKVLMTMEYKKP